MTRQHEQIKLGHEAHVAGLLAEHLAANAVSVSNIRAGDPSRGEPDAVFDGDHAKSGIEVTCVSYGARGTAEAAAHAQDLYAIARGEPEKSRTLLRPGETTEAFLNRAPLFENFDADLPGNIQSLIVGKCGKSYALSTYLVVDARMLHLPLTPADEHEAIIPSLRVPPNCAFLGVFVVMQYNASERLAFFEIPRST